MRIGCFLNNGYCFGKTIHRKGDGARAAKYPRIGLYGKHFADAGNGTRRDLSNPIVIDFDRVRVGDLHLNRDLSALSSHIVSALFDDKQRRFCLRYRYRFGYAPCQDSHNSLPGIIGRIGCYIHFYLMSTRFSRRGGKNAPGFRRGHLPIDIRFNGQLLHLGSVSK